MKHNTPLEELENLQSEDDALDQSVALNRIVMSMLESKKREDFWRNIILLISLLVNIAIATIFVVYESQWTTTTTTTTTTVTQDTGEGEGNNVYQSGENASYFQGASEEVTPDGQASNSNYYNDTYKDQSSTVYENNGNSYDENQLSE